MASDMLRLAAGFYQDRVQRSVRSPLDWRRQAFLLGALLGLPLICLPLAGALAHFILEERFNQSPGTAPRTPRGGAPNGAAVRLDAPDGPLLRASR
jgi:hypothetical protein